MIGPNGAGKTTLLSILAGVQSADGQRRASPAQGIGWVPQQPAVYTKLTVAENLDCSPASSGSATPGRGRRGCSSQTDLAQRADEQVGRLSGGNRQRVNIAVGMLSAPAVLLLDEPSAALDPIQRERLWEFVHGLTRHGTCVIFSTHNVSEAERHAGRTLVLDEGRLLFDGPPAGIVGDGSDFEGAFVAFLRRRRA